MIVKSILALTAIAAVAAWSSTPAVAQAPKRGGTLIIGVEGEPPNFDLHQSASIFALAQARPYYSNLVRFDQNNYPKILPDAAESWSIAADGLAYTFKLNANVKFHDGSAMTSDDVKATFDRIRNPPSTIPSIRKADFADIASIDTPDPQTVVFRLSGRNAAFLDLMANPFNVIYSARKLQENPVHPATQPMGTGPYTFSPSDYAKGAYNNGKRFDGYFRQGLPHLDGYRIQVMAAGGPINALLAGQVDAMFRGLLPQEKATLENGLGDKIVTNGQPLSLLTMVAVNVRRKPFDDIRVRRALNLAIDHRGQIENLKKITNQFAWGGIMRPGYDMARSDDELAQYAGFGKDINAARAEARRLLAEAGVPNLKVTLLNRNSGTYVPLGIFTLDQWRQIGIDAQQESLDAAIVIARTAAGDFDVTNDTNVSPGDDPTQMLIKYVPGNSQNYGGVTDPMLTDLYNQQKVELDRTKRGQIVRQFEDRMLSQAYIVPQFWAGNNPARRSYVKNWTPTSSFYMGWDLTEVWLDGK